jgi:nitrilase
VKRAKLDPEERKEVWSRGGSCIIGPLGEVLAGPLWDEAGIIYAEVSMKDRWSCG